MINLSIKDSIPMPIRMVYRDCRSAINLFVSTIRLIGTDYPKITFLSNYEAVNEIVNHGKSLARFGDGEFSWILGRDIAQGYQKISDELTERLREVLEASEDRLMIGVLKVLNDDSNMNFRAKSHWREFKVDYQQRILDLLDLERTYVDASITRPYIDLRDKTGAQREFDNLKRIWKRRNVLLVEGLESRLGVGNDLFEDVKSLRRILCPSKDAFSCYDSILKAVIDNFCPGDIVLLALGPTATILAYDLCRKDIQSVDIGHIDNEYEWMLMGAKRKVGIPGKAVDEVGSYSGFFCGDSKYESSIVALVETN